MGKTLPYGKKGGGPPLIRRPKRRSTPKDKTMPSLKSDQDIHMKNMEKESNTRNILHSPITARQPKHQKGLRDSTNLPTRHSSNRTATAAKSVAKPTTAAAVVIAREVGVGKRKGDSPSTFRPTIRTTAKATATRAATAATKNICHADKDLQENRRYKSITPRVDNRMIYQDHFHAGGTSSKSQFFGSTFAEQVEKVRKKPQFENEMPFCSHNKTLNEKSDVTSGLDSNPNESSFEFNSTSMTHRRFTAEKLKTTQSMSNINNHAESMNMNNEKLKKDDASRSKIDGLGRPPKAPIIPKKRSIQASNTMDSRSSRAAISSTATCHIYPSRSGDDNRYAQPIPPRMNSSAYMNTNGMDFIFRGPRDRNTVDALGRPIVTKNMMERVKQSEADNASLLKMMLQSCDNGKKSRENHSSQRQFHHTNSLVASNSCDAGLASSACTLIGSIVGGESLKRSNSVDGSEITMVKNFVQEQEEWVHQEKQQEKQQEYQKQQLSLHTSLPPGWVVRISKTRNCPYYIHPDFGSTWFCPVLLPKSPIASTLDPPIASLIVPKSETRDTSIYEAKENRKREYHRRAENEDDDDDIGRGFRIDYSNTSNTSNILQNERMSEEGSNSDMLNGSKSNWSTALEVPTSPKDDVFEGVYEHQKDSLPDENDANRSMENNVVHVAGSSKNIVLRQRTASTAQGNTEHCQTSKPSHVKSVTANEQHALPTDVTGPKDNFQMQDTMPLDAKESSDGDEVDPYGEERYIQEPDLPQDYDSNTNDAEYVNGDNKVADMKRETSPDSLTYELNRHEDHRDDERSTNEPSPMSVSSQVYNNDTVYDGGAPETENATAFDSHVNESSHKHDGISMNHDYQMCTSSTNHMNEIKNGEHDDGNGNENVDNNENIDDGDDIENFEFVENNDDCDDESNMNGNISTPASDGISFSVAKKQNDLSIKSSDVSSESALSLVDAKRKFLKSKGRSLGWTPSCRATNPHVPLCSLQALGDNNMGIGSLRSSTRGQQRKKRRNKTIFVGNQRKTKSRRLPSSASEKVTRIRL